MSICTLQGRKRGGVRVMGGAVMRGAVLRGAVLIAGASMLAPAAAWARVPYRSSGQAEAGSSAAPAPPAAPIAVAKTPADSCDAGACKGPAPVLPGALNDHRYATALTWIDTPAEAGKLAEKERKLVFVIQLSGDFTRNEFT